MEEVLCPVHKKACVLKTGTQPGSSYGVSFFMCLANYQKQKCTFVQRSKAPAMTCPVHGEMVGLQILSKNGKFSYRCSGLSSGKVCGHMDLTEAKENVDPALVKSKSRSSNTSQPPFTSPNTTRDSPPNASVVSSGSESSKSSTSSSLYLTAKTQRYNVTTTLSPSSSGKHTDSSDGGSVNCSPKTVTSEAGEVIHTATLSPSPITISDTSGSGLTSSEHDTTRSATARVAGSSSYHVPEAPNNVSELFVDVSTQNQSVEAVQQNNHPRVSVARFSDGSPVLSSPVSLENREGSGGDAGRRSSADGRREHSFSLSSEERERNETSLHDSNLEEEESDIEDESMLSHAHTCDVAPSPSLDATVQYDGEWHPENEGEVSNRGESMLMKHFAAVLSPASRQSGAEEESDACDEAAEEGVEVLAKSFTKYRTATHSDSDSDKEEAEEGDSEAEEEGGSSYIEGTSATFSDMNKSGASSDVEDLEEKSSFADSANSQHEDGEVSALYQSCMSEGTPDSSIDLPTIDLRPPNSTKKLFVPFLSDGNNTAAGVYTKNSNSLSDDDSDTSPGHVPGHSDKKINPSLSNDKCRRLMPRDGAHSTSHNYSPLNSSQSSSVVELNSEFKPHPKLLSNVSPRPIVLSPDTDPVDQHPSMKPKSLEAYEDSGATASGGEVGDVKAAAEDEEVVKPERQFQVGYQYRTVVKQLMETQTLIQTMSHRLPDGGAALRQRKEALLARLERLKRPAPDLTHPAPSGPDVQMHHKNRLTYQAKMLTVGAVEHLHLSLSNCPTEDTLADTPTGFRVELMKHQRRALAWMLWRETQTPSAGILADDMGLGKTLSLISLVMNEKRNGVKEWLAKPAKEGMVKSAGTLVVCPASLMMQWEGEVKSKLRPHALSTKIYHGSNRTRFPHDLAAYDLVITTYNIVGIEGGSCEEEDPALQSSSFKPKKKKRTSSTTTLFKIHWRRVILDEAHVIRNHKTALSIGACKLESDYRWAVTGTPIQNQLKDFYSLVKFIRLGPFDDYRVWRDTVERKGSLGMKRLDTVVSSLVLRRTKEDIDKATLKLTKRNVESHTIQLFKEEKQVYDILFAEARKVMYSWLQEQGEDVNMEGATRTGEAAEREEAESTDGKGEGEGGAEEKDPVPLEVERLVNTIMQPYLVGTSKGRCVLGLLLRLRQCCCHLSLLTSALRHSEEDQEDMDLELAMESLSLRGDTTDRREGAEDMGGACRPGSYRYSATDKIPTEFLKGQKSTKVQEVLKALKSIASRSVDAPEKSVIVSQWTSMLDIMQQHLDDAGITHVRIDGTVPPSKRLSRVEWFNSPKKDPSVMLLSLQAGGVGLNLIGGNHIFMLDMHWNPALETQAGDRCHRMGQKRDVFIHKFVCEGTVEERIQMLQKKKLELAQSVLDGASEQGRARFKRNNKLTLNDLKLLFEIQ